MANLSIYLFWIGLATSVMAGVTYFAYVASASLSFRRMAAQTSAGMVVFLKRRLRRPSRPSTAITLATRLRAVCTPSWRSCW